MCNCGTRPSAQDELNGTLQIETNEAKKDILFRPESSVFQVGLHEGNLTWRMQKGVIQIEMEIELQRRAPWAHAVLFFRPDGQVKPSLVPSLDLRALSFAGRVPGTLDVRGVKRRAKAPATPRGSRVEPSIDRWANDGRSGVSMSGVWTRSESAQLLRAESKTESKTLGPPRLRSSCACSLFEQCHGVILLRYTHRT